MHSVICWRPQRDLDVPEAHKPVLGLGFTLLGRAALFGRVEGGSDREGVGMGLFLTKEIISQHGGDIWYEAKDNGSDFVFTLPK